MFSSYNLDNTKIPTSSQELESNHKQPVTKTKIFSAGATCMGNRNENQDTFFIGTHMFGVFDGHGDKGLSCAETACKVFANASLDAGFSKLDAGFSKIFADAENTVKIVCPHTYHGAGGTTASILYIDPLEGYCKVAHVGDSEVRYYDTEGDGVSLTSDHSPTSLEEFHRIRSQITIPAEHEFQKYSAFSARPVFIKSNDEWIMDPKGGNKYCTVRNDWGTYLVCPDTGQRLAVTRALGDFNMKRCGVSAEPTITTVDKPAPNVIRAIVMASDGLWDIMQYAEVGAIVRTPAVLGNAEAATTVLMAAAKASAKKHFGDNADDITAIVVYMTVEPSETTLVSKNLP